MNSFIHFSFITVEYLFLFYNHYVKYFSFYIVSNIMKYVKLSVVLEDIYKIFE